MGAAGMFWISMCEVDDEGLLPRRGFPTHGAGAATGETLFEDGAAMAFLDASHFFEPLQIAVNRHSRDRAGLGEFFDGSAALGGDQVQDLSFTFGG